MKFLSMNILFLCTITLLSIKMIEAQGYKQRKPNKTPKDYPGCNTKPGQKFTISEFKKCRPVCYDFVCNVPMDYKDCCEDYMKKEYTYGDLTVETITGENSNVPNLIDENIINTFFKWNGIHAIHECYKGFNEEIHLHCTMKNKTGSESNSAEKERCPYFRTMKPTCTGFYEAMESCLVAHEKWNALCRNKAISRRKRWVDVNDMPFY